jgi:UDP-N-acetylmuramoylalanine--D-glutamate ligase
VYDNTRVACVYNLADEATLHMVEEADVVEGCRAVGFGPGAPGPSDLGVVDGIVVDRAFHDDRRNSAFELTTRGELAAVGLAAPHSVSNVLAASALVRAYGVAPAVIREALATFRIDHHRTETVLESDGILWVDDSKATNPHAADAALSAFSQVVWIVGGLLKGVDVDALVAKHAGRLAAAIIIGVDRRALHEAFARAGNARGCSFVGRCGPAGGYGSARSGCRVDGPVRRLRRPRPSLRSGGPRPGRPRPHAAGRHVDGRLGWRCGG